MEQHPSLTLQTDKGEKTKACPECEVRLSPLLEDVAQLNVDRVYIKDFLGSDIEAVVPLAGGTESFTDENGKLAWRSPVSSGVDSNSLPTFAGFRVAATYPLIKDGDIPCMVMGEYPEDTQPHPYRVVREEFIQMGVKDERIISNPNIYDTVDELIRIVENCTREGWNTVACITNQYHIPRIGLFLNNLEWLLFKREDTDVLRKGLKDFRNGEIRIILLSAERLLGQYESVYDTHIRPVLKGKSLSNRIHAERQGVEALRKGEYRRYNSATGKRVVMRKPLVETIMT